MRGGDKTRKSEFPRFTQLGGSEEKEVKARVRIQGSVAGQYETRIAAINKSLREQEREEEERRKLIKAKERQKIVEKVDKYRCELLRHEVTLLEERKNKEERDRLHAIQENTERKRYVQWQKQKVFEY